MKFRLKDCLSHLAARAAFVATSLLAWLMGQASARAGIPANTLPAFSSMGQGTANINSSGSQMTVNQTSGNALINWSSFNIGSGATVSFIQPSASSVTWNYINDSSASQIYGRIDGSSAPGYIVLQNPNGFYVGGSASITTHGLVMTTSPTPAPNLSSGGAWQFDAPPPASQIINYGQIKVNGGGSLFLIASDIENRSGIDDQGNNGVGTLSAPGGKIGLYDGEQVLVSTSPDGHGLSAKVTLPQGSVDNEGRLIADGGTIAALAQTVNNNGLVQANSVQNNNGVIELVAAGSLSLGANSDIEANGDNTATSTSPGGFVVLKSGDTYADAPTSEIHVGGQNGGQNGVVEIFGSGSVQSTIGDTLALLVNPLDISLSSDPTDASSLNFNVTDLANFSQIDLHALDNIELSVPWALRNSSTPASLSLQAGNSIILDPGTRIAGGTGWSIDLFAGTGFVPTVAHPSPVAGTDGIYLNGGAVVQTQDGSITVSAANEVIIQNSVLDDSGSIATPSGAIRTQGGGSISVTTEYGDVNAGNSPYGYTFGLATAPYYKVNAARLGGISTAAGGNVTINAGGNVISYLPTQTDYNNNSYAFDGGTGAFGLSNPGNVTITAGGSVFGNYVVADGTGTIFAGRNAGVAATLTDNKTDFALSLVKGSWSVNAQNIYLDDVMNPNGVFNDSQSNPAGAHLFDYDLNASLSLNAANIVEITGGEVPLIPGSYTGLPIPVLLPPTLEVVTGAGGFILGTDVILFPSPNGNVNITTLNGGDFSNLGLVLGLNPADIQAYNLQMSDSAQTQWSPSVGNNEATEIFGYGDHGATPTELNNPNAVQIHISGDMNDVNLYATKHTDLTVDGNMYNSGFVGENLHATDVTSINVGGHVSFSPIYTFVTLSQGLPLGWDSIFSKLVDPIAAAAPIPVDDVGSASSLKSLANSALIFPITTPNPGFVYDAATKQLGFAYQMSALAHTALTGTADGLTGTLRTIQLDASGNPVIQLGQASLGQDPTRYYFATTPVTSFVPTSVIDTLYNNSLGLSPNTTPSAKDQQHLSVGFQIGGPGQLDVNVKGSLDLGATAGILSWGGADGSQSPGGVNYAPLDVLTGNAGAGVHVTTGGNLDMLTSTIASIGGGDVTVDSTAGEINLGLSGLALTPSLSGNLAYGIYTSAAGNVDVTAYDSINVDTARIATFNGGNIYVESQNGDVNAGNGANLDLQVIFYLFDPATGFPVPLANKPIQQPRPYGSGILALSPTAPYQVSPGKIKGGAELPGNITVVTPKGNIVSTLGGIAQFALNGNIAGGPTVTLVAGTEGVKGDKTQGNIELGQGGVIGGTVNLSAQGNISGLIVSRQNTTVTAAQNIDVTVLSGGNANVAAGGSLSGTLIGVGSINASGGSGITATMISSSVSANGGASQSTLGAATASTASQSAANQSGNDAKQELASNDNGSDDDKKKKKSMLMQRVKRVTVILPKT